MYETSDPPQLTERQIERARSLGRRLNPQVFESVLHYGLYAQVRLAGIADEVMTRLDLSADDRSDFVVLLKRMRRLDPARHRPNLVRRFLPTLRRGSRAEDVLLERYDRLCHRLDRMLPEIDAASRQIGETLSLFDTLFDRNRTYLDELDLLIYGARLRVESLRDEQDTDLDQQLAHQTERVEQRIVDLEASADTARETGPTIRRIQDDLRSLLLEAQYTSLNTATRWKHRFADTITRVRQLDVRSFEEETHAEIEIAQPGAASEATAEPITVVAAQPFGLAATLRSWSGIVRRLFKPRDEVNLSDLWWG